MPILPRRDVTKSSVALNVADATSFDVEKCQALGIFGPNGAGKSTLFNLINGNLSPGAGTVQIRDRDAPACHGPGADGCGAVGPDPPAFRQADGVREPAGRGGFRARRVGTRRGGRLRRDPAAHEG